jgi:hypothetical protein
MNFAKSAVWQVVIQSDTTFDALISALSSISLYDKGKSTIDSRMQIFFSSCSKYHASECFGGRPVRRSGRSSVGSQLTITGDPPHKKQNLSILNQLLITTT